VNPGRTEPVISRVRRPLIVCVSDAALISAIACGDAACVPASVGW
jgi:hypothetical protein